MRFQRLCQPTFAALLLGAGHAFAAGGHHAVDDAAILERGACELESWATRARDGERLLHAGLNCGAGFVEFGLAGDYARLAGSSQTGWSAQAKTAHAFNDRFSIGASLTAGWQAHVRPRYAGSTLAGLATWNVLDGWAVHANVGRDFVHQGDDEPRGGVSIEWTPVAAWSFVAERYREWDTHFARAGVRWSPAPRWQLDASGAKRLSGPLPSLWTVGVTYSWD